MANNLKKNSTSSYHETQLAPSRHALDRIPAHSNHNLHHRTNMPAHTKEQLGAVSRLLQACKHCGAVFRTGLTTDITMPDGTVHGLQDRDDVWIVFRKVSSTLTHERVIPKHYTAEQIKLCLLQHHVIILELSAGLRHSWG